MQQRKSKPSIDTGLPRDQVITTFNQTQVLAAVKIFFGGVSAADYIHHLTWLQSDWLYALVAEHKLKGLGDHDLEYIAEITYRLGKVMTLISKLDEIVDYDIDDLLRGGSISKEELLRGVI